MFASLPMYDRPETRAAHDALWSAVRGHLGYGPDTLDRSVDHVQGWGRPDLLLGQICNLPYRVDFADRVTRIACADYGLDDTPAGYYHSVFVTRAGDAPRGLAPALLGRFAYNDALSQSGWGAPHEYVTSRGLAFHSTVRTGAHLDSALAVANGHADLAAIDAVTWRMLQLYEPAIANLKVVDRTRLSPGMTFITAKGNDPAPLFAALQHGVANLAPAHRATLGIRSFKALPATAYDIAPPPLP